MVFSDVISVFKYLILFTHDNELHCYSRTAPKYKNARILVVNIFKKNAVEWKTWYWRWRMFLCSSSSAVGLWLSRLKIHKKNSTVLRLISYSWKEKGNDLTNDSDYIYKKKTLLLTVCTAKTCSVTLDCSGPFFRARATCKYLPMSFFHVFPSVSNTVNNKEL